MTIGTATLKSLHIPKGNINSKLTNFLDFSSVRSLSKKQQNDKALELCGTAWGTYYVLHEATGKESLVTKELFCGERNCVYCVGDRRKSMELRLYPTWKAIKKTKITHIIVTHPEIPYEDMTKNMLLHIRKKFRSFLKMLSRTPGRYWGYYCLELKYRPARGVFTPHIHMANFGYAHDQKYLTERWSKILGVPLAVVKTQYRRSKMYALRYFSKRCAMAGLVEVDGVTPDSSFYQDPVSHDIHTQLPQEKYLDLIKGSRLFVKYGAFPAGVLALTEIYETEIQDKLNEYTVIFLGYTTKNKGDTIPPPELADTKGFLSVYNEFAQSEDSERYTSGTLLWMAWQDFRGIEK